jgi:transcriptional regulator with XRE-family HTH domain
MTLTTLGGQLKAARALLRITQRQVARKLGRSVDRIRRAEGDDPSARMVALAMRGVLMRNGAEFIDDGVRVAFWPAHRGQPPGQASRIQVRSSGGAQR